MDPANNSSWIGVSLLVFSESKMSLRSRTPNHGPLMGITLAVPAIAQRPRSVAKWEGKCKVTEFSLIFLSVSPTIRHCARRPYGRQSLQRSGVGGQMRDSVLQ
jgi:hypothetical protein